MMFGWILYGYSGKGCNCYWEMFPKAEDARRMVAVAALGSVDVLINLVLHVIAHAENDGRRF